jgi:hypothetical protein
VRRKVAQVDGCHGRIAEVEVLAERIGQLHLAALDRLGKELAGEHLRDRADLEDSGVVGVDEGGADPPTLDDCDRSAVAGVDERRADEVEQLLVARGRARRCLGGGRRRRSDAPGEQEASGDGDDRDHLEHTGHRVSHAHQTSVRR